MSWTVLLVDDDPDITDVLQEILAARGYRVVTAGNGAAALQVSREHALRPSVILLDLMMPVVDGLQFLEVRRGEPLLRDVPVIVVTAQPDRASELVGKVRVVLSKPVTLQTLLGWIDRVCHE